MRQNHDKIDSQGKCWPFLFMFLKFGGLIVWLRLIINLFIFLLGLFENIYIIVHICFHYFSILFSHFLHFSMLTFGFLRAKRQ